MYNILIFSGRENEINYQSSTSREKANFAQRFHKLLELIKPQDLRHKTRKGVLDHEEVPERQRYLEDPLLRVC